MKRNYIILAITAMLLTAVAANFWKAPAKEPTQIEIAKKPHAKKPKPENTTIAIATEEKTIAVQPAPEEEETNYESAADSLHALMQADPELDKVAEIQKISCEENKCIVEAEAKGDEINWFQMRFIEFAQAHPEYGTKVEIDPSENLRHATFTFTKDKE